ncbi:hypothetical protein [Flavihumibacter fluvii]|uniref:hypothetical protein n=1 Tax=Flavihumibacter fluvii TaxID=2838157 RepID=UPI001BDE5046|nr:hypothetical protein [Flavihumibacter fluvii]ULQ50608.1 hypothetical protein KJS93_11000 [Flavihumibacter fluvii]
MRIIKVLSSMVLAMALFSCGASQPAAGTESYIAPGYQKKKFDKMLVLGTMKDEVGRKKAETSLVDLLNRSGYKAGATYTFFNINEIKSREELQEKVKTFPFDAIIVLTYLGTSTTITDNVGVASTTPVVTSWNFFDLYTSPAYDFTYDAQAQKAGKVYASLYTSEKYEKQWGTIIQLNMSNGVDMAADILAGNVLGRMKRDKIL